MRLNEAWTPDELRTNTRKLKAAASSEPAKRPRKMITEAMINTLEQWDLPARVIACALRMDTERLAGTQRVIAGMLEGRRRTG